MYNMEFKKFFFYFSSGMQILFRLEKKLSGIEMNILFPYTVYETCFFLVVVNGLPDVGIVDLGLNFGFG